MENGYYRPLIPLLLSFIAGIVLGYGCPGAGIWFILLSIGITAILACKIIFSRETVLLPLMLFVCLGYLSIQFWVSPDYPKNHIVHFLDQGKWDITAKLSNDPLVKNNRSQCHLKVISLAKPSEEPFSVCGNLRLTILGKPLKLAKGDTIRFSGRPRSLRNFSNPGGYDYQTQMAFKGIRGSVYTTCDKLRLLDSENTSHTRQSVSFRTKVARQIEMSTSQTAASILNALILGDRSAISHTVRDMINRAGLGHLLAISGLHIGIVASFSFFVCRWLLSYCPWLIRHARVKKVAAILSILPALLYGCFSGMSPSTQRAVIMVCAFMMTFLVERENDVLNTLAVAAFIILVVFPPSLFLVSFQLSFAAVWIIIMGMAYLPSFSKPESSFVAKSLRYVISFFAVSFLATLGTLPLVMYYFHQVSLIGWLANVIGIPLIGFLVVPMGLVSTVLATVSIKAAGFGFYLCGTIVDAAFAMIELLAGLDFAAIKTISPSILEMICFYAILGSLFYIRKSALPKYLILLACLVMSLDVAYWTHRRYFSDDLRVTVFDVGQGFGSLVEFPKGKTMMIDGGGFSDNSVFDVGERIVAPYLWQNKIKTVDFLVLSHPNSDHINGLTYIAKHFNVKTVWTNGEAAKTFAYDAFVKAVHDSQIYMPAFGDIPRQQTLNKVTIRILHPAGDFSISPIMSKYSNSNDHSIVVKLIYNQSSILFPGDIEAAAEREMVSLSTSDLKSNVLISPHHGSKSSSTDIFLTKVDPETIIIPAGYNNRFGFPHPSVLEKYKKITNQIYRTDLHGAIIIETDGRTFDFQPTIPNEID